jgi:PKD repeat protein
MPPAYPGARHPVLRSSSRRRLVAALAGALATVIGLTVACPAFAVPVARFTVSPATPAPGQAVTFTSTSTDPVGPILTRSWDFDGNGTVDATGSPVTTRYATPGPRTVTLHVTAADGAADARHTVTVLVPNALPKASFKVVPSTVQAGTAATFISTSSDPDGRIVSAAWDFDNDGHFHDAVGNTVQRAFPTPGVQPVHLKVTDDRGGVQVADGMITVTATLAPLASFTVSPQPVVAGTAVTLTSQSTDPDGPITGLAWDLNGDGAFTDAAGATVQTVFPAPGTYKVALQATDSARHSSVAFQNVVVVAPAAGPAGAAFVQPFPVVRLRGLVQPHWVLIRRLTVVAPRGAHLRVRCLGRGCGRKRKILTVANSTGATMRIRAMERRLYPGARLQVYVTQPGAIGKYTRFLIPPHGAPQRRDRCLQPGALAPTLCP